MENLLQRKLQYLLVKMSRIWFPATRRKVIHTRINDYDLLVLVNEDVGRRIHCVMRYEFADSKFLRKAIRPNDICVDLGANVGYFTMLMAQAATAGKVYTFEPIALNAALLRASVELNGFSNVRINECAVGDHVGVVSFSQSSDSAYSSIHDTGRMPLERTVTVPVVTLDEYLDREGVARVDILKADVEGAEGMVVAGAAKLLADEKRRPRVVLLELYDQNLRAFGISVNDVVVKMQGFGYEPFVVNARGEMIQFSDELKARSDNVLFIPSGLQGNQ